jgi:predicted nucleic acid-binding protein
MVNVAIDTNVLVYAEEVVASARRDAAVDLLRRLPRETTMIPVQALGELYRVLVRKLRESPRNARASVAEWGDTFPIIETSPAILLAALDLSVRNRLDIWDAVILAAAADAGCRLLLSEDFQEGFSWSGVTVTNPFSPKRHLLLEALLKEQ